MVVVVKIVIKIKVKGLVTVLEIEVIVSILAYNLADSVAPLKSLVSFVGCNPVGKSDKQYIIKIFLLAEVQKIPQLFL